MGTGSSSAQIVAPWAALCFAATAWGGLQEPGAADPHAAHRKQLETARGSYTVNTAAYEVPDVSLLDESGREVPLGTLLKGGGPLALNFIFTTCTTICPVMTATFAQMRRELGPDVARIRMISISIDPEYDRPAVLKRYAELYGAGAGWTFLTGSGLDVKRVLEAFGASGGSKMNHRPLTLLRPGLESAWVRIDGLASGHDLAREARERLLN